MSSGISITPVGHAKRTTLQHRLLIVAYCAIAGLNITSCVAEQPYNPDKLGPEQFARVSEVCQTVMGLSPNEALSSGNWLGNSRLDNDTNHYRGCILSLSDSLQSVTDDQVTQQADENCRAKGFKPGSPELALCVLRSVNSHPDPAPAQSSVVTATPISALVTPSKRSFFTASPHETARREQAACAALGLSPAQGAFKSCVRQLDGTFYAIDHPIN
ncbi:MAG: hypothetical protein JWO04_4717 [Gammaproteobacteria bacterium]|nr:hypothetical protein [Gammaproteobacteria bacterium]